MSIPNVKSGYLNTCKHNCSCFFGGGVGALLQMPLNFELSTRFNTRAIACTTGKEPEQAKKKESP
jgi:hypothetical protein